MTTIRNKYIGITHPITSDGISDKEHDTILEAWKHSNCIQGIHLFDECLSSSDNGPEHYLYCDACGIEVHINKVVIPDGKDQEI